MSYRKLVISAILAFSLIPVAVLAHHSRAEFSSEVVEMEGELVAVMWRNPHAGLDLRVTNAQGVDEIWRIETFGSPNLFSRMGVNESHFIVGDRIRIAGSVSTRRPNYFLGVHALVQDGLEVVMSATEEPRWTDNHVGGVDQSVVDLSRIVDAASENKGIFRNWSIAGRTAGVSNRNPYTAEARAAMAVWDPVAAPIARCEPPGMPTTMIQPLSFQVIDAGNDTIQVQTEYFGTLRTIHMGEPAAPETIEHSLLGYSVGRWEGNTLVVETSHINYPYYNGSGAPQSENVRTTEYFALSEDQTQVQYRIEITDPLTFTETAFSERLFVALGDEFVPLDCTLF